MARGSQFHAELLGRYMFRYRPRAYAPQRTPTPADLRYERVKPLGLQLLRQTLCVRLDGEDA
jgi:hypothetical protein